MRFHAEHRFSSPVDAVLELLADPDFYLGLVLPDLSQPEVLEQRNEGGISALRLRYEFTGNLDPIAKRLIGAQRLAWIQEIRVHPAAATGTLAFGAETDPERLHGSAAFTVARDSAGTVRQLQGELVVAVPGVGRMAERRIVPGLLRRLDLEAEAVEQQIGLQD